MGELLRKMASGGVELALIDGKLKARGNLTDENCVFIQSYKAELIAELQRKADESKGTDQIRRGAGDRAEGIQREITGSKGGGGPCASTVAGGDQAAQP